MDYTVLVAHWMHVLNRAKFWKSNEEITDIFKVALEEQSIQQKVAQLSHQVVYNNSL